MILTILEAFVEIERHVANSSNLVTTEVHNKNSVSSGTPVAPSSSSSDIVPWPVFQLSDVGATCLSQSQGLLQSKLVYIVKERNPQAS